MASLLKLGDYQLIEKIAQGGMAQVYKAKTIDPLGIERLVVIKRILPHIASHPEYIDMLIDEAKIAVNFTHGNIAQIYDLGRSGDDYFIVMEYVDGKTISQILRELKKRGENIPVEIAAFCFIEICKGLDYIHRKQDSQGKTLGVVHRDISPQNIILSYSGTVKIIDFGVAKADDKITQTESGVLKGKFAYMSPEQASGEPIDCRSDLFSAGILLWELLTLERLFKRKTNPETVKAVQKDDVDAPSRKRKDVPKDLDRIVLKALQKKKKNRYQSASDMADDLNRFLFRHYPDFKPMQAVEFLNHYFGPEPDEALEAQPVVIEEKKTEEPKLKKNNFEKLSLPDEEITKKEGQTAAKIVVPKTDWGKLGFIAVGLVLVACVTVLLVKSFFKATVNLSVDPPNTVVRLEDKELVSTTHNGKYKFQVKSGHAEKLSFELDHYKRQDKDLLLKPGEVIVLNVVMEKEIPPFGSLDIQSVPAGAALFLDDVPLPQMTPAVLEQLANERKVKVTLQLSGFETVSLEETIVGGQTKVISQQLKPKHIPLLVEGAGEGATIIVDGGTDLFCLYGQSFTLQIQKEGFEPYQTSDACDQPDQKAVLVNLRPLVEPPPPQAAPSVTKTVPVAPQAALPVVIQPESTSPQRKLVPLVPIQR